MKLHDVLMAVAVAFLIIGLVELILLADFTGVLP